jgi:hypothetical protein
MDHDQAVQLFHTLCRCGKPWAAVMMCLQVACAERAGAIAQMRVSWLRNLSPDAMGVPVVAIPEGVNGKTPAREVPLNGTLAAQLRRWLYRDPLHGTGPLAHTQWPMQGQLLGPNAYLFPGLLVKGNVLARNWEKPITTRGYSKAFQEAAESLRCSRAVCREGPAAPAHVFEGFDLSRLGTHSLKRSAVTWLKEFTHSISIAAEISGTSASTLERFYDAPTAKRVRGALLAFEPVFTSIRT